MNIKYALKNLHINGGFYYLHPLCAALYYISALVLCFVQSPAGIAAALFIMIVFSVIRGNWKSFVYCLPLAVFIIILNPIFNHSGETVLFTLFGCNYTLESFSAGFQEAAVILCAVLIFSFFNLSVNDERFMELCGGFFPKISIMLLMIFRHTELLKNAYEETKNMAEINGISLKTKSFKNKLKIGSAFLDGITSAALENSIDTGISMAARGFLNKNKTRIKKYRFGLRDAVFIIVISGIFACSFIKPLSVPSAAVFFLFTSDFFCGGESV